VSFTAEVSEKTLSEQGLAWYRAAPSTDGTTWPSALTRSVWRIGVCWKKRWLGSSVPDEARYLREIGMVQAVLQPDVYGDGLPLGVSLKMQDRLEGMAPDWPESPAAVALRTLQEVSGEALPQDSAGLFSQ
jgi:hypothetical protein